MNDKQFDPLENRLRQAAEQFEPTYDEADWESMEKLLDKKKNKKRPVIFWWLPDVLMVSLMLILMNQLKVERVIPETTSKAIIAKSIQKEKQELKPTQVDNFHQQENEKKNISENVQIITKDNHEKSTHHTTKKQRLQIHPKTSEDLSGNENKKYTRQGELNLSTSNPVTNHLVKVAPNTPTIQNENLEVLSADNHKAGFTPDTSADRTESKLEEMQKPNSSNNSIITGISDTVQHFDSIGLPVHLKENKSISDTNSGTHISSQKRHFFITPIFGMEKSGVKGSSLGATGNIFGAFAGYQWHKNWRARLGFLLTDKKYSGGSGVYKLPPDSYYRDITDFKAICEIIEIPLLISYQFRQGKKSNWAISAGPVTSIMKSEDYHYYYISNSGSIGYGAKYYTTNSVDWFSAFRISPSYEHLVGKRFSISAEPFLQLPLTGVGQGSVKLYSMGFLLGTSIYMGSLKIK
jgi:uncharacterized protein YdaU (DUF1376 family)